MPESDRKALIERYIALRTAIVLYDAQNSTSYEEEISGLIRTVVDLDGLADGPIEYLSGLVQELEQQADD